MRKRRIWLDLAVLVALAALGALLWRVMRPEEPAPPEEPTAWAWTKVAERTVPGGDVRSLAAADVAGSEAPDLIAASDRLYVLEESGPAAPVDVYPEHAAADYALRFGRTAGGQRVRLDDVGGAMSGEVEARAGDRALWRWKTDGFLRMARWGDLDGDGADDLAVSSFHDGKWTLTVLDGRDGLPRWSHHVMAGWIQVLPREAGGPRRVLGPHDGTGVYVTDDPGTGQVFCYTAEGDCLKPLSGPGNRTQRFSVARMEPGNVQILGAIFDPTRVFGGVKATMRLEARSASGGYLWSVRDETEDAASFMPDASAVLSPKPLGAHAADLDGDGVREWVLRDRPDRLLVKSAEGRQVAAMPLAAGAPWTVLERPGQVAVVVTASGGGLTSWEAKP